MRRKMRFLFFQFGIALNALLRARFILKLLKIYIGKSVFIKRSVLKGRIKLGHYCQINGSKFYGEVSIFKNSSIFKTVLSKKIIVGCNSTVESSHFDGTIKIRQKAKISNTTIIGNVNIKENSSISDSYLSGNILIGANSFVEGLTVYGDFSVKDNFKVFGGTVTLVGNVEIGRYSSLNGPNTDIFTAVNGVKIGNFCSIARNVSIQEYNHNLNKLSTYNIFSNVFGESRMDDIESKGDIVIEHDVWIGTQCVILTGSFISIGVVVAANSVVSGFIPPYAIVGGSPAKIIKYRFSETVITQLLNSQWWNWSDEKLKRNKLFFCSNNVNLEQIVD